MLRFFLTAASTQYWCGRCLGLSMLLVLLSFRTAESAVTLAWDPNPESDVIGYIVSYGTNARQYTTTIDVGATTTFVFTQPDPAKVYYLAVQAYNGAGLRSVYSNEVSTSAPNLPLTATGLTSNAPAQPSTGNTITFAAAATGGVPQYQYKWWVTDGSRARVGQNWSTSNTFRWTPTQPKPNYQITVWVRSVSTTADTLENPAATLSMAVTVSPNPRSTLTAGQGRRPTETASNAGLPPSTSTSAVNGTSQPSTSAVPPSSASTNAIAATSNQLPRPADTPKRETSPAPQTPTNTNSTQASPTVARTGSTPGSAANSPDNTRRLGAATPAPPPSTQILIMSPPAVGAPVPGAIPRPNAQSRNDVPPYEPPPPYEVPPPPPSARMGTVSANSAPSISAAPPNPESRNSNVVTIRNKSVVNGTQAPKADVVETDPVNQELLASGPAPMVTSVVPSSGSAKGGTTVTITGTHFVPGATVRFGGVPAATIVLVASSTSIVATTPSHADGIVSVVVTNPDRKSGAQASGFRYIAPTPPSSVSTPPPFAPPPRPAE